MSRLSTPRYLVSTWISVWTHDGKRVTAASAGTGNIPLALLTHAMLQRCGMAHHVNWALTPQLIYNPGDPETSETQCQSPIGQ
jgi:hypothetical protein